eukprot:TRINITY_DN37184_c0_g1_i1.p1 TRINITY_DN37184_c0_g1~~TRINITY_DN37184_c0_g1_i1.p1  ORF type:complete len:576 (-),score=104.56 TRINITY_DN37184_c0_g1_i1:159-1862(-)
MAVSVGVGDSITQPPLGAACTEDPDDDLDKESMALPVGAASSAARSSASGASAAPALRHGAGATRNLPPPTLRPRDVGLMFIWLLVTEIMVNFDGGGTAAVLEHLERGCTENPGYDPLYPCLDASDQGMLGCLPYVGLCIASPIMGQLLQRRSEKNVILLGLIGNAIATLCFAFMMQREILFVAKFLVGIFHSGVVIYAPVWVDAFAPVESKTLWLGITQGSVALGVMVGYAVAGYIVAMGFFYQFAFKFQSFWLCFTCLIYWMIPAQYINVSSITGAGGQASEEREVLSQCMDAPAPAPKVDKLTVFQQFRMLAGNRMYCSICFELCALFFVVTGVQYWSSKYFKVSFGRADVEVTSIFILVAGTGPVAGVTIGSAIIDRLGGYRDAEGVRRTTALCTAWGFIAMLAGLIASLIEPGPPEEATGSTRFYGVVVCIAVQLFFGGAMLPPATGVLLTSVPEHNKPFASGVAMLMYNLFGYALGAYLPGRAAVFLREGASAQAQMTMQITFAWAIVAFLGSSLTCLFSRGLVMPQARDLSMDPGDLEEATPAAPAVAAVLAGSSRTKSL